MKDKKHNGIISFWKFVFSLLVVLMHTTLFDDAPENSIFSLGSIGVEFFFITSGYLMAYSAFKDKNDKIGNSTYEFLSKKIKKLFPYALIFWITGNIICIRYVKYGVKEVVLTLVELFFLRMSGFVAYSANAPTWYVSAMLICMLIIYPLLKKYKEEYLKIIAPLIVILIGGYISHEYVDLRTATLWTGVAYKGLLRAFVELNVGVIVYSIVRNFKKLKITVTFKVILTIIETLAFLIPVYFAHFITDELLFDWLYVALLAIGITIAFAEHSYNKYICNNKLVYYLEEISTSIYFSHYSVLLLIKYNRHFANFTYYEKTLLLVVLTIVVSCITNFVIKKLEQKNYYIYKIKKLLLNQEE